MDGIDEQIIQQDIGQIGVHADTAIVEIGEQFETAGPDQIFELHQLLSDEIGQRDLVRMCELVILDLWSATAGIDSTC